MAGIVGVIGKEPSEVGRQLVQLMVASLAGPSGRQPAICSEPELSTYVGKACRPDLLDVAAPAGKEDGPPTLILTGDVVSRDGIPDPPTRKEEGGRDVRCAEILQLYEQLGDAFVARLNGCFAGVLVDRLRRRCLVFNDRYGVQRLFIHESQDAFYFASEAKALLAVLPATREFDATGVCQFLLWNATLDGWSLYHDVHVMPAGSVYTFEHGRSIVKKRYYAPAARRLIARSEFVGRFAETLPRIVNRYLRADRAPGISLTGGLDSRMILAGLGHHGSAQCYTFGSEYRDTTDVEVARTVAAACGRPHRVIPLGPEFRRALPEHLERAVYIADGYLGLSGAAELYANSQARLIAPVRLTGNYGGELLRGDGGRNAVNLHHAVTAPEIRAHLDAVRREYSTRLRRSGLPAALFQQTAWLGYGRHRIEQSQILPRTPFLDNDLVDLVLDASPDPGSGHEASLAAIRRSKPQLLAIPTDRGCLPGSGSLATSVSRLYQEALFKGEYWVSHGAPHPVAALTSMRGWSWIEEYFLGRHKFYHFRRWLKLDLADYVREQLFGSMSGPLSRFFDIAVLKDMVAAHLAGRKNFLAEIDGALTLALAQRLVIDASVPCTRTLPARVAAS